ncbi:hypothetical protein [Confluentibacter flavum]|nr:hypothetical protein [Confluentibacter flavum]
MSETKKIVKFKDLPEEEKLRQKEVFKKALAKYLDSQKKDS